VTPDEYRQAQADLAAQTEGTTAALYGVFVAGGVLTLAEAAELMGTIVAGANTAAAALADAYVSSLLQVAPQGIGRPVEEPDVLSAAIAGLLSEDEPLPRLRRLASSEPFVSSRHASREAMQRQKVTHYRWDLDDDPCGKCRSLGSHPWAISVPALSHPNCQCIVVPIIREVEAA